MMDLIVSFVADLIGDLFNEIIALLAPLLGFSFQRFVDAFPYANTGYLIFQYCALVLILLIGGYQMARWIWPSSDQGKTNPLRILYGVLLATGFVYFGNYLLEGILDLCVFPYEALMEAESDKIAYSFKGILSLGSVLQDAFAKYSSVLYIILFCMIGWAFLKLMLESVERYIVLFLLIYASPLAASTLASESTSGIYKRFFTMFVSQCVLMILNIWVLKLAVSMFQNYGGNGDLLTLLLGWGLLKVGSRLDSYVNQLGLNAAVTGMGLAGEIGMVAGMMLNRGGGGVISSGSGNSGNGGSGNPLGAAKQFGATASKYIPTAALGSGILNAGKAVSQTLGQSIQAGNASFGEGGIVGAAVERIRNGGATPSSPVSDPDTAPSSGAGTPASFGEAFRNAGGVAKQTWSDNIDKGLHRANMQTQEDSVWARAVGGTSRRTAENRYFSGGSEPPTEQDRGNVAGYSHVADQIFRRAAAEDAIIEEPENVAAVIQGVGVEKVNPSAGEFVDAGYGTLDGVSDLEYSLEGDGIHAAYTKGGTKHQMDIISGETYSSLPAEEQHGYSGFKSADGQQYYYRQTAQREKKMPRDGASAAPAGNSKPAATAGVTSKPVSAPAPRPAPGSGRSPKSGPAPVSEQKQDMPGSGATVDGPKPAPAPNPGETPKAAPAPEQKRDISSGGGSMVDRQKPAPAPTSGGAAKPVTASEPGIETISAGKTAAEGVKADPAPVRDSVEAPKPVSAPGQKRETVFHESPTADAPTPVPSPVKPVGNTPAAQPVSQTPVPDSGKPAPDADKPAKGPYTKKPVKFGK